MRFFNFLLASDVVGGLGPPEGLIKKSSNTEAEMLIFLGVFVIIVIGIVIYISVIKNNNNKGDE